MRWAALVVALLCAARAADAADGVGVVVSGETALRDEVAARFEERLRERGFTIVASPLSTDAVNTIANCFTLDDLVCARGVFEARSKANALVYVRLDVAGKNVTFNVYWFTKGKEAIGERRVCAKCERAAWHELTDTMLKRLVTDGPAPGGGGGSSRRGGEDRPSRLGPGLLLAAGVVTVAAGGVFLYYGSLDGADQKYVYPSSTPIGIAVGTVGIGAAIGGTIWLIQTGSTQSGPVASATSGGAYVGWAGRF